MMTMGSESKGSASSPEETKCANCSLEAVR